MPRLMLVALLSCSLVLTACGRKEPKVLRPIAKVSIVVLDYLGKPVPNHPVEVVRPLQGRQWGADDVTAGTTDERGRIEFTDLLEEDSVRVQSSDERFRGSASLDPTKAAYTITMNRFGVGVATHGSRINSGKYRADVDAMSDTVDKIVGHYVKVGDKAFYSLEHYVTEGVIAKAEADRMLRLRPLLVVADEAIIFRWGRERLLIKDYTQPINWVPYSFSMHD